MCSEDDGLREFQEELLIEAVVDVLDVALVLPAFDDLLGIACGDAKALPEVCHGEHVRQDAITELHEFGATFKLDVGEPPCHFSQRDGSFVSSFVSLIVYEYNGFLFLFLSSSTPSPLYATVSGTLVL